MNGAATEPWFSALRKNTLCLPTEFMDGHFENMATIPEADFEALLAVAEAASEFIATTTVFQQRKVSRDAFTRLSVSVHWPNDPRAANSQKDAS